MKKHIIQFCAIGILAVVVWVGIAIPSAADAALGTACGAHSECTGAGTRTFTCRGGDGIVGSGTGICVGPCNTDADCTTFATSQGWVNAACTAGGVAGAEGACIEQPVRGVPTGITSGATFIQAIDAIADWIFVFVMVAAVIFIVLAAFQFLTGGGEPQQIAEARRKLIYAAIAIIVASLARGIPSVIANIVGL